MPLLLLKGAIMVLTLFSGWSVWKRRLAVVKRKRLRHNHLSNPRIKAVEALEDRTLLSAWVVTDQLDYPPGATAIINGGGFEVGETIQLQVLHTDGVPNTGEGHEPWYVVDGGEGDLDGVADGSFTTTWYVSPDDSANSAFELSALGLSSGLLATHAFTDGAQLAPSTPDLDAASDTGVSNTDNITSDTTPTFSGTVDVHAVGLNVKVELFATDSSMVTTKIGEVTVTRTATGPNPVAWSITSSALAEGTYTVFARASHMHGINTLISPNSPGLSVTIDTTAPVSTIVFPPQDDPMNVVVETYTLSTWNAGNATPGVGDIGGTASDPVSGGVNSGVAKVEVSIQQDSTGLYWDGDGFDSATEVLHAATLAGGNWSLPFAFTNFTSDGQYTVRAHATDVAGNFEASPFATFQIGVDAVDVSLVDDPLCPGKKMLLIEGTPDDDHIVVSPLGNTGGLVVQVWNGTEFAPVFTYGGPNADGSDADSDPDGMICRIVVLAGGGNDNVQIAGSVGYQAWLYGQEGHDRLKGGAGLNVLVGGDGHDLLLGGSGANLLIGGRGGDRLNGNGGDDILIAGYTDYDDRGAGDEAALKSILENWTASGGYNDHVNAVKTQILSAAHDDDDEDLLTGAAGADLFFASMSDSITDLAKKGKTAEQWYLV